MRKMAIILIAAAVGVAVARPAHAAPRSFDGNCQFVGVVAGSYTSEVITLKGAGTCTGMLDGKMVQEAPISVATKGTVQGFAVPLLGFGSGTLSFTKAGVTFPVAYQQVGTILRSYPACMGCAGVAFGAIDPLSEAQPKPHPSGPRTRIRVVSQVARTFTTP